MLTWQIESLGMDELLKSATNSLYYGTGFNNSQTCTIFAPNRKKHFEQMLHEYKLPSLGDGVTGKVTEILVKAGDKVTKEQIVIIVGTDKVDAEMPVDMEGTVAEIIVKTGDDVTEGSLILKIETAAAAAPVVTPASPAASSAPAAATPAASSAPAAAPASPAPSAAAVSYEYKLPSLGDGVTGKVTEILVKVGDTVAKEQIVIIVGTDKVDAEMPVDAAGTIEAILVNKGDDVTEGSAILRLSTASQPAAAPVTPVAAPATPAAAAATPAAAVPAVTSAPQQTSTAPLRVSPLARKRAKELGIDLAQVKPSEGAGRISYKDVVDFVKKKMDNAGGAAATGGGLPHKSLPNFDKFGTTERQALSRIGVLTADNMHYAFNTIPHAWISEKADITRLEELRQQFKDQVKTAGGALTTTAILTKVVSTVLKKMPQFNASYDADTKEVIYKKFYNIGIAVDTPRGLLVPVIRNTDQKGLTQISVDLTEISTRTRDGKNKPEDLDGGTFTISNIGGIGGTNMLSIVNWPQVAILSITAASMEAVWNESTKSFEPRLMMPMTIGWDHRVINGADAARFLRNIKQLLEEPFVSWL
jgi:pyruvate dehydrogenase E2 component (dihydrolipoamide acetyltransferase)